MSSKLIVSALLALVACTDEPVLVTVTTTATMAIQLGPDNIERLSDDEAAYRWELVVAPEASAVELPAAAEVLRFVPDARGVYLVERWIEYGLSERLTHRFVVHANGMAPVAVGPAALNGSVGGVVTLDGSASHSDEGLALVYRWRLTSRPQHSAAQLTAPDTATALLTPDLAGTYAAELVVFDGQLWSNPAAVTVTAQ